MAHESFEDNDTAEALNKDFISIKVDREERPDVDAVYMSVCQALTGSGGWPLTIIMTPEQKPFWAGTYLPKKAGYGRMGLQELLAAVKEQWDTNREKMLAAGDQIVSLLQEQERSASKRSDPHKELLHSAVNWFRRTYDEKWGGFGAAPKFPTPHNLLLLLRYSVMEGDKLALDMAEHTLSQMFRGGLFDHIGGGFSRYSTDEKWLVPHFEKMLYDNALLAYTYLEAYHITRRPFYRTVAQKTLDYVIRELTDSRGGFYCGQDADSEGEEGKYYVFTPREIRQVLGNTDGEVFCRRFGIGERGNFEGKSILNLIDNPGYEESSAHIDMLCNKLYEYRKPRTYLHKDDKVLTSWNGLMIAAMAKAGRLLNEPCYLQTAEKAQGFLAENLFDTQGRLMLRWREGEVSHAGQLDDYAFYAFSLLELYESTFKIYYLQQAVRISAQMMELFFDWDKGGFYLYAGDGEQLISRPKEVYDGAVPSGNSMAAVVIARLAKLTGEEKWRQAQEQQMRFLAGMIEDYPAGHSMSLLALFAEFYSSQELVCVTADDVCPAELRDLLCEKVLSNLTVLLKTGKNEGELAEIASFTVQYPIPEEGAVYYLCQNGACAAPVREIDAIKDQLGMLDKAGKSVIVKW